MKDFVYDVHPGVCMVQKWLAELPEKTGRSVEQWIDHVKSKGPATEIERRAWLKAEHGLGTIGASWIAERCDGKGMEEDSPESYLKVANEWVDGMFAGKKAHLRPIYDELLRVVKHLGPDVRVCPGKTIIPFYRSRVFAQVKPTTNTRVDVGFALGQTPLSGRMVDTGGFAKKDRITHRIPVASVDEIDEEVIHWLRWTYEKDA